MNKKNTHRILEIVIAVLLSFIIMRLFKGPWISAGMVYHRFTWVLLAPIQILRNLNNAFVMIFGYCLLWVYMGWTKANTIRDRMTYLFTSFWAVVGLLPFILAGFSAFSLSVFSLYRISSLGMLVLYAILICVYFLIFRYYFGLKIWLSAWWTILITMLIVIMNTLFSLLPQLASQPFLNSLNYTTYRLTSTVNSIPVLVFILCTVVSWISLRYIRNNFIDSKKRHRFPAWVTPLSVTIITVLTFNFIYNDLLRYRKFNYQQGINTIYMCKLEGHVMTWCNNRHFGFVLNSAKLIYPFTMEPLPDSLHRHARRLGRLTMIEGLDFFRYERILHVLAYGNRDTVLYKSMKPLLVNNYYHPASIRSFVDDIFKRYKNNSDEILINGSVQINGKPLANARFQVALFNGKTSMPIWMRKTGADGFFAFSCYNPDRGGNNINIHFLIPDSLINGRIAAIEIINLPPVISQPDHYQLDTFKLNIVKDDGEIKIFEFHLYARSALDGCRLTLPDGFSMPSRINANTAAQGFLREIKYSTPIQDSAGIVPDRLRRFVNNWRIYSVENTENQVEIYLNYNRN